MRDRFSHLHPLYWHKRFSQCGLRLGINVLCALPLLCGALYAPAYAQDPMRGLTDGAQSSKSTPAWLNGDNVLTMSPDQALWAALAFEDADKVRAILDRGANANAPDPLSQMTPLMAAETLPVTLTLIERGANPLARDRTGRTALHYAVTMREATKIVPVLVRKGAEVDARTEDGNRYTPLMIAVENYIEGSDDKAKASFSLLIRELKHLGANINAADARGTTPIATAAKHNQPELIRLLIELGADPAQRLNNGLTPLDYAREAGAQDAIQILAAIASKTGPAN